MLTQCRLEASWLLLFSIFSSSYAQDLLGGLLGGLGGGQQSGGLLGGLGGGLGGLGGRKPANGLLPPGGLFGPNGLINLGLKSGPQGNGVNAGLNIPIPGMGPLRLKGGLTSGSGPGMDKSGVNGQISIPMPFGIPPIQLGGSVNKQKQVGADGQLTGREKSQASGSIGLGPLSVGGTVTSGPSGPKVPPKPTRRGNVGSGLGEGLGRLGNVINRAFSTRPQTPINKAPVKSEDSVETDQNDAIKQAAQN